MPASPYVSRINQIDATQLDHEIYEIFRTQTKKVTKYIQPGKIDKWQPEFDILIKFIIWYYSLRNGSSTFGQQLLNLRYGNFSQKKAFLYFLLTALSKYAKERLVESQFVVIPRNNDHVRSYLEWAANIIHFIELFNLLLFLHRGTQPQLIEKILGISSQPAQLHKPRSIGYSYMTRELLWHGLIELFTVGLPMVNFYYIKQKWNQLWSRRRKLDKIPKISPQMNQWTNCPHCNQRPILPRHAGCEHVFCYYCLQAHFMATDTFPCPECGTNLNSSDMSLYVASS